MTEAKQPEALRLLQEYRKTMPSEVLHLWANDACDTMHRQHERIAELEAQLDAIGAGGVEPLRKQGGHVLIDFDQVGTAGPFAVVDGRVHLPGETMMDLARMLKPTIDAMEAAPQAVQAINGQSLCQVREAFFKKYGREPLADDVSFAKMVVAAFAAPAHPAEGVPAQAEPFMWAIQEPGGSAYMDENCVSTSRGIVEAEVDGLNLGLGADDEPYKVVPVYLAATQPAAQGLEADSFAQTMSDWAHGDAQDAERYRMMRDRSESLDNAKHCIFERDGWEIHGLLHGNDLDMVIDAALAAQSKKCGA